MLRAVMSVVEAPAIYGHLGRGPAVFDELGFVKACAQAALDWDPVAAAVVAQLLLEDFTDYDPFPARGIHGETAARLMRRWGMTQLALTAARPGDILAYQGRGPAVLVLVVEAFPRRQVAGVDDADAPSIWPEQPSIGRTPCNAFRWPEAAQ
jgi:hypothetical protein